MAPVGHQFMKRDPYKVHVHVTKNPNNELRQCTRKALLLWKQRSLICRSYDKGASLSSPAFKCLPTKALSPWVVHRYIAKTQPCLPAECLRYLTFDVVCFLKTDDSWLIGVRGRPTKRDTMHKMAKYEQKWNTHVLLIFDKYFKWFRIIGTMCGGFITAVGKMSPLDHFSPDKNQSAKGK